MCMFNNQTTKVNPSNTILLGGRCRRQGQLVHYLGYFNQVNSDKPKGGRHNFFDDDELFALMDSITGENRTNRHSQPRVQAPSFGYHAKPAVQQRGNAMLIPIPAVKGTFSAKNLIPLGRNNTVFADYARAITAPEDGLLSFSTRGSRSFSPDVEVVKGFDDGLYDLVIASSAAIIPSVLDSIAADKRPEVNVDLYNKLDLLYPGWSWLLFCFSMADADKAGGALITYTSQYPDLIILPGLDGHSGDVETGNVEVDHTLIVGSENFQSHAEPVDGQRNLWTRQNTYLPERVIGTKVSRSMPQGDFIFNATEVDNGVFNCLRDLPPGWEQVFGPGLLRPPYCFGDTQSRWS
jgi:hypothetical protein